MTSKGSDSGNGNVLHWLIFRYEDDICLQRNYATVHSEILEKGIYFVRPGN